MFIATHCQKHLDLTAKLPQHHSFVFNYSRDILFGVTELNRYHQGHRAFFSARVPWVDRSESCPSKGQQSLVFHKVSLYVVT
jgi:hypothetical protein